MRSGVTKLVLLSVHIVSGRDEFDGHAKAWAVERQPNQNRQTFGHKKARKGLEAAAEISRAPIGATHVCVVALDFLCLFVATWSLSFGLPASGGLRLPR